MLLIVCPASSSRASRWERCTAPRGGGEGGPMADVTQRLCDRFLAQMHAHHRARDHYPDPWEIGAELQLTPAHTLAVVEALWARGWIGRSPYDTERLRVTPRGWEHVLRQPAT